MPSSDLRIVQKFHNRYSAEDLQNLSRASYHRCAYLDSFGGTCVYEILGATEQHKPICYYVVEVADAYKHRGSIRNGDIVAVVYFPDDPDGKERNKEFRKHIDTVKVDLRLE